jgi:hypothetical protein
MIFLILVLQFNSLSKPFIVLTEIFFSIIGVFIGYAVTGMSMAMIMVGVGIIGLAGIVIKNGILLIEFTDELRGRGYKTRAAAIEAGKIRIIPVMLTALATMLGLCYRWRWFQYQFRFPVPAWHTAYFLWWRQRCILGTIELDHHLRIDLRVLLNIGDGTKYVHHQ